MMRDIDAREYGAIEGGVVEPTQEELDIFCPLWQMGLCPVLF